MLINSELIKILLTLLLARGVREDGEAEAGAWWRGRRIDRLINGHPKFHGYSPSENGTPIHPLDRHTAADMKNGTLDRWIQCLIVLYYKKMHDVMTKAKCIVDYKFFYQKHPGCC
jgi:hypothetical protein